MTEATISRWLAGLVAAVSLLSILIACAKGIGETEILPDEPTEETTEEIPVEKSLPPDTLLFESLGGGRCAVAGIGSWQSPELRIPEKSPVGDVVIRISARAFFGSEILERVWIPSTISEIGTMAFGGCVGLSLIEVDESNPYFTAVEGVLYTKDLRTLMHYPSKRTGTEIWISKTVAVISEMAFYGCENLAVVRYGSTAADWERIAIAPRNYSLTAAAVHYEQSKS